MLELEIANPGIDGWYGALRELPGVHAANMENHTLRVQVEDLLDVSPRLLLWLREHGYRCTHMASARADLETVFLTLTGRSVRNA